MKVQELNREQLTELKQNYICEVLSEEASYFEMAFADDVVSDSQVISYYSGVEFVEDDFICWEA